MISLIACHFDSHIFFAEVINKCHKCFDSMIRSLQLTNFRSHTNFKLDKLGRVNLLVGTNNSGKTSILEAIELLLAHGDPRNIWTALTRRGERISEDEERRGATEIDLCRLFHGYSMDLGSSFHLNATCDENDQFLTAKMVESNYPQDELPLTDPDALFASNSLSLTWQSGAKEENTALPITERGGLSIDTLRRRIGRRDEVLEPVVFITTSSFGADEVSSLLSRVILNPEEELLLRALRIIEPSIERLAPVSSFRSANLSSQIPSKGGVVIKCAGVDKRLPIGTMGDGIWRLLALSLALIRASGGVLLVDEIDTGLHYSVMEKMWQLVYETANRLNVQVFATTHSSDCWKSLASISRENVSESSEVTIQRIDTKISNAIHFSEQEIVLAANGNIEIR